jgi:hypothetical protein
MSGPYGSFVIPSTLAVPTDLANWTGAAAPANAIPLLRSATSLVLEATSTAYYSTDPLTGLATDPQLSVALRDATCIQAAAWATLGFNPLTGGVVTSQVKSKKSIGTAHIEYADAAIAAQARADAIAGLVPDAMRMLEQNNLITPRVWVFG